MLWIRSNKWIGSALIETRLYNLQPLHRPSALKLLSPIISNFLNNGLWVATPYVVQQRCLNKWIGSALIETRLYNFQPLHRPSALKLLSPIISNFLNNALWVAIPAKMSEQANRKSIAAYMMVQPSTTHTSLSPQTPRPQNFNVWNSRAQHADHGSYRQRSVAIYTSLFTVNGSKSKKKMKKYTKTNYLQHISSASHTVETTDKSVLSLYKQFTWQSKIEHQLTFGHDIDVACKK